MLSSEHFRCTFWRLSIRMMSLSLTVWGLTPLCVLVVVSVDLFTVHCSNFRLYIVTLLRLVYGFISSMSSPLTCFSLAGTKSFKQWKQLTKAMSWLYVLPYEDSDIFSDFIKSFLRFLIFFWFLSSLTFCFLILHIWSIWCELLVLTSWHLLYPAVSMTFASSYAIFLFSVWISFYINFLAVSCLS